jgi:hypothetical protein
MTEKMPLYLQITPNSVAEEHIGLWRQLQVQEVPNRGHLSSEPR